MARNVVTAAANVALPYQPSGTSGLNSRTIVASGTLVLLNDAEYAALSTTAFSGGTLLDAGDPTGHGGAVVTKSLTLTAATLDLFNVVGNVKVTELFGRVTTALDATGTNIRLAFDATVTAAVTNLSADLAVASDVLGQLYSIVGVAATATSKPAVAASYLLPAVKLPAEGIILPAGKIQLISSAINAGVIQWIVSYYPISSGASITAA
jgi:hypothetical protein